MRDWTRGPINLLYLIGGLLAALILILLVLISLDALWQEHPAMLLLVVAPVIFYLIAYNTPQARARRRRAARSPATHGTHHKNANRE